MQTQREGASNKSHLLPQSYTQRNKNEIEASWSSVRLQFYACLFAAFAMVFRIDRSKSQTENNLIFLHFTDFTVFDLSWWNLICPLFYGN